MRIEMRIREVREKKNISLNELAKMTNISKSHLSNIERGEKEPTLSVVIRIALALRVQETELYKIHF